MLVIKINGTAAELDPEEGITITGTNPMFSEDRIPSAYSYPYSFPMSPHNLVLFNYPDRITSLMDKQEFPCEIWYDEVLIDAGTFVIEEVSESIDGHFKGAETNDNFTKTLNELDLGYRAEDGYDFDMQYAEYANSRDSEPCKFAPVHLFGDDVKREGDLATWNNYINYTTTDGRVHRNFFPAVSVWWLLEQIIGPQLKYNPFKTETWLSKLVVQTFRNGDYAYPNVSKHTSLADYFNDMDASEFVIEILRTFCASVFIKNNEYEIVFHNRLFLDDMPAIDLTDKITTPYTLLRSEGEAYNYGYENEPDDDIEGTPDEVVNYNNLYAVDANPSIDPENMPTYISPYVYVRSTKETFLRSANLAAESRWKYDIVRSGLGSRNDEKEGYNAISKLRPMDMALNTILGSTDGSPKYRVMTPQIRLDDLGSDRDPALMLFTGSKTDNNGATYPVLQPYKVDTIPDTFRFYLTWDALLSEFHADFKAWLAKPKRELKCTALLDLLDINQLDLQRRYYIAGRYFFLRSYSVTLLHNHIEPTEMEFVER